MPQHTQPEQNYVVQDGDTLPKIAFKKGLGSSKAILDDAKNTTLKKDRPDPELLLPGDQLWVPPPDVKKDPKGTGKKYPWVKQVTTITLQVKLLDGDHK